MSKPPDKKDIPSLSGPTGKLPKGWGTKEVQNGTHTLTIVTSPGNFEWQVGKLARNRGRMQFSPWNFKGSPVSIVARP